MTFNSCLNFILQLSVKNQQIPQCWSKPDLSLFISNLIKTRDYLSAEKVES